MPVVLTCLYLPYIWSYGSTYQSATFNLYNSQIYNLIPFFQKLNFNWLIKARYSKISWRCEGSVATCLWYLASLWSRSTSRTIYCTANIRSTVIKYKSQGIYNHWMRREKSMSNTTRRKWAVKYMYIYYYQNGFEEAVAHSLRTIRYERYMSSDRVFGPGK